MRELDRLAVGKHPSHLIVKVVPLVHTPEVRDEKETAVQQVFSQALDFLVGQDEVDPPAEIVWIDVNEGIVDEIGVCQLESPIRPG